MICLCWIVRKISLFILRPQLFLCFLSWPKRIRQRRKTENRKVLGSTSVKETVKTKRLKSIVKKVKKVVPSSGDDSDPSETDRMCYPFFPFVPRVPSPTTIHIISSSESSHSNDGVYSLVGTQPETTATEATSSVQPPPVEPRE